MFWAAVASAAVVAVVPVVLHRRAVARACARVVAEAEQFTVEAAVLREVEEGLWLAVEDDDDQAV